MKFLVKLCIPVSLLLLAACATTPESAEEAGAQAPEGGATVTRETPAAEAGGAEVIAAPGAGGLEVSPLEEPGSLLSKRVIYFDFDKSDIRPEFRDIIAAHAEYLAEHPEARVTLEGHADERGTREYNMALGERRANAVRAFLTLQGASPEQIDTVSYGEERPVAFGHDEQSWRLNRRVEIVYR